MYRACSLVAALPCGGAKGQVAGGSHPMAPRSSNSKTAAIAGTLAGLLAAGLGAYYLYSERQPAQPAAPATTVAAVANAGGAQFAVRAAHRRYAGQFAACGG
eukprot:gene28184-35000_t